MINLELNLKEQSKAAIIGFLVMSMLMNFINFYLNNNTVMCHVVMMTEQGEEEAARNTECMFNKIPSNIRNKFDESGWTVQVVPTETLNKVGNVPEGYYTAGVTRVKYNTILINDRTDCSDAVVHEMGHWVDCSNGLNTFSTSKEFQKIFAEEGQNYTEYGAMSAVEFFAEIFYGVITGDPLVENCPKAASYVRGVIANF